MCEEIIKIGRGVYMACGEKTCKIPEGSLPNSIVNAAVRRGVEALSGSRKRRVEKVQERIGLEGLDAIFPRLLGTEMFIRLAEEISSCRVPAGSGGERRIDRGRGGSRNSACWRNRINRGDKSDQHR